MDEQDCVDCGETGAYDDWETLEGTPLCVDCADGRICDRGTVPQEWIIEN